MKKKLAHDAFFGHAMHDLTVVKDFLKQFLEDALLESVDLSSLSICKDKHITPKLMNRETDMLYRVKLHSKEEMFITIHVEHQSTPQKEMPLRVMRYCVEIMENHLKNYNTIPLVYTMVYYNGEKPWAYATDIKKLIQAPQSLVDKYALQPFHLIELNKIKDESLREYILSGVMSMVMKHIYAKDLYQSLETIAQVCREIVKEHTPNYIEGMVHYLYQKAEYLTDEDLKTFIDQILPEERGEKLMSLAEQHIAQGIKQGMQQGIQQGMQQGIQQGRKEVAKAMLNQGMQESTIANITGLDLAIVEGLKESIEMS